MKEEILFSRNDIFSVLEGQKQSVKKRAESIPANTVLNASEHDLVQALVEEFRLVVPVLREEGICIAMPGRLRSMSVENIKAAKWRLALSLAVQVKMDSCVLECELHALERVPTKGRGKPVEFVPIRFVFTNKLGRTRSCCWPSMPSCSQNCWDAKSASGK